MPSWPSPVPPRFDVCNKVVSSLVTLVSSPSYANKLGSVSVEEVKSLAKVAIGNSIACLKAVGGGEGSERGKLRCRTEGEFDVCDIVGGGSC